MSTECSGRSNPFSSRYVRPGAIPFFFPEDCRVELLLSRLEENGWQGEILGRHGSGKSALLAHLIPGIHQAASTSCTKAPADFPNPSPIRTPRRRRWSC